MRSKLCFVLALFAAIISFVWRKVSFQILLGMPRSEDIGTDKFAPKRIIILFAVRLFQYDGMADFYDSHKTSIFSYTQQSTYYSNR